MSSDLPAISVVIPTFNEQHHIRACLDSVLAQDYSADRVEVVVVDGDSTDGTAALVDTYGATTGRVRRLRNPRRIVPHALNLESARPAARSSPGSTRTPRSSPTTCAKA